MGNVAQLREELTSLGIRTNSNVHDNSYSYALLIISSGLLNVSQLENSKYRIRNHLTLRSLLLLTQYPS